MRENAKVIIYPYSPKSIGLTSDKLQKNTIIVAPYAMKEHYLNYNQDNVLFVRSYNYTSIVDIIQELVKKYILLEFIVLSEQDIEFGGFLNDFYGSCKIAQGLTNATLYRNKYFMRTCLKGKVNQPEFYLVRSKPMIYNICNKSNKFWIMKPLSKDSAQGIIKIDEQNLKKVELYEESYILEEMIEYEVMYTTDGICVGQDIVEFFINQYDKPILETFGNSKRHITRTHSLDLDKRLKEMLFESTKIILETFNKHGEVLPFHMEWFFTKDADVIFCEAASRFGGKIGSLIQTCYDFSIFDRYWDIKLSNKDVVFTSFNEIRNPEKISFNYSAYKNNGKLTFIPKFENKNVNFKVELNQNYVASSTIQENAFELYETYNSEREYVEAIQKLDKLSSSLIYE
ncbi:hypothetical protein [Listeria innocua]|uniref:hypothetical protein n=1 Tax=Listeria innocua TaxID=1642 RepID=UPI0016277EC6|nr:hypothetical protein [Listeria innocua]MBC1925132.1 hypothetical protein [Listeria innocua]